MSGHGPRGKVAFRCDFCTTALVKRTSHLTHEHPRHDSFICPNPVCAASYTGHTELTGIARPSGLPHEPPSAPPSPTYAREIAQRACRIQHSGRQLDLLDTLPSSADH